MVAGEVRRSVEGRRDKSKIGSCEQGRARRDQWEWGKASVSGRWEEEMEGKRGLGHTDL